MIKLRSVEDLRLNVCDRVFAKLFGNFTSDLSDERGAQVATQLAERARISNDDKGIPILLDKRPIQKCAYRSDIIVFMETTEVGIGRSATMTPT